MKTKKTIQSILFIAFSFLLINVGFAQSNSTKVKKNDKIMVKKEAKEFHVPLKILKSYVGVYAINLDRDVVITLENNQLFGEPTGQTKVGFRPKSNTMFYLDDVDAEMEFNLDKSGAVIGITLYKNGREMHATRL